MTELANVWQNSSNAFLGFAGMRAGYQSSLAPGAKIAAYVHHNGAETGDFQEIEARVQTTLNSALAECREDKGDVVLVLPGHAENVAAADAMFNLKSGCRIIGGGHGNLRPTFTWSTAGSTFLLDQENVSIENCIFEMAGPAGTTAITVAAPMTISAAGCSIIGCKIHTEIDADQGSTIAITTTAAADDLTIAGCYIYGSGDGTLTTTLIRFVGADRLKMYDNVITGYPSSVNMGVVQFVTTASLGIDIQRCVFHHALANSVSPVVGHAGDTGVVIDCSLMKDAADDLTLAKAWLNATLQKFAGARVCNDAAENAAPATVLSS
jgi:hypothetical protein